jgi:hypothetical protein
MAIVSSLGDFMHPSCLGKFVKVHALIHTIPGAPSLKSKDWWLLEEELHYEDTKGSAMVPAAREPYLTRIDPDEGQFDSEKDDQKTPTEA